jgi:hypothetical protein
MATILILEGIREVNNWTEVPYIYNIYLNQAGVQFNLYEQKADKTEITGAGTHNKLSSIVPYHLLSRMYL